jgi:PAS domain S-box-containing protein
VLETGLFALLEQTADAAYTVTESGEICSWNRAAEQLFGYPANEVLRRHIDDVFGARDALDTEAFARGSEAATRHCDEGSSGIPNFDLEVRTRSGDRIWVNVSTILFDHRQTGRRLLVRLSRDVNQRRRNEELLSRMVEPPVESLRSPMRPTTPPSRRSPYMSGASSSCSPEATTPRPSPGS